MTEFTVLTKYNPKATRPHSGTRPLIPIQMLLPNNTWSKPVTFNFDTGASLPTDIPLQLLDAFGYRETKNDRDRPTYDKKIRIPNSGLPDMTVPCMLQNEDHYDLFREQDNRYPLLRVRDLMPFVSIVYHLDRTIIRSRDMNPPPETRAPGAVMFPDARKRDGTPTSSWYWNKWTMVNPNSPAKKHTDWFQWCTGDYRMIVKRSIVDRVGIKRKRTDDDNSDCYASFEFTEGIPATGRLTNVLIDARDDDADFARGGDPRNICGGMSILKYWSRAIWDLHSAAIPTGQ